MNATHEHWIDRLSDYLDGGLDTNERTALEAHLSTCASCTAVLDDLRALVTGAHGLGGIAPERDLWPGIAAAIGAPAKEAQGHADVIRLPTSAPAERARSGIFLTLPQLAAASIALAIVSATATLWAGPGLGAGRASSGDPLPPAGAVLQASDPAGPSPELSAELKELERTLAGVRDQLEPNTVRILEKNLGVIERAIDESRRALAVDPGNAFLREHLDRAYRDKVDYLRQAATVADWTS